MIFRTACVVLAVALGTTAVVAQSSAIAERKEIMKGVGAAAKSGAAIVKGAEPYDNAKAVAVFATYASSAAKIVNLFPEIPRPVAKPPQRRKSGRTWLALKRPWRNSKLIRKQRRLR